MNDLAYIIIGKIVFWAIIGIGIIITISLIISVVDDIKTRR